jgi:hypothetical protein
VPENAASTSASKPKPPTAYRPLSDDGRTKGKGKAGVRAEPVRRAKGDWILDLDEVARGTDRWNERDRVILVVGSEFESAAGIAVQHQQLTIRPDGRHAGAAIVQPILLGHACPRRIGRTPSFNRGPHVAFLPSPNLCRPDHLPHTPAFHSRLQTSRRCLPCPGHRRTSHNPCAALSTGHVPFACAHTSPARLR